MAELTPEEKRQRALRAEEVLNGASWAIDELVMQFQRDWIAAPTLKEREDIHSTATAALHLKAHLLGIVNAQKGQEKLDERRADRT